MRLVLGLEYNGLRFSGWQTQPDKSSIQDAVEIALSKFTGESIRVVSAGRTDAGVHALGQVIHFDTEVFRNCHSWVAGTNTHLPRDISVTWARVVASEFHARYSAISRTYSYFLLNRPARPGLFDGKVGWYKKQLFIEDMQKAAEQLIGTHDFTTFRSASCQAKSAVRTIYKIKIQRFSELIRIDFTANAFLQHMIRNIVGSLLLVGGGSETPGWMKDIIARKNRVFAGMTFSPDGLFLIDVQYDKQWGLPSQVGRLSILGG